MKTTGHVIVELHVERLHVHHRNRPGTSHRVLQFIVHEGEVWHRVRVVEFQGIRVHANKFSIPRLEREILFPVHLQENIHPVPENIVIPQQGHVRDFQLPHNIPHPQELLRQAEIGYIPAVDHEVHVIPLVERLHEIFRLVIPTLAISH